jgi:glucose-6-phosphate dehydrogenase assembly protein OpcA
MAEDVAMPADLAMLGTPVEVGSISRELKKLWLADQTRTRATLFNFAIVCEGEAAMQESTELLARFVGSHAFRAILIGIEPAPGETSVKAWINAHCYLPKAGAKHVCSEQVSLYVKGDVRGALPNLLFQQLDYDLPLTLWWRGDRLDHLHPEVWRWVDRLIFDSQCWTDAKQNIAVLREQVESQRTVLCDLAWTRTLHLRQSLAQMFDTPEHASALRHLEHVAISHAPGARTSACLLLGWLAAQLNWVQQPSHTGNITFRDADLSITCELAEEAGLGVTRVQLRAKDLVVTAQRNPGNNFLHLEVREPDGRLLQHLMPADCADLGDLLDEELASGGLHRVYGKALTVAETLL